MPDTLPAALIIGVGIPAGTLAALGLLRFLRFTAVNLLARLTMRAGVRYTGRRWQIVRAYVLDRDGHRCCRCRKSYRTMDVHHRQPLSRLGSHQTWNLETLCRSCHERRHPHMRR